MVLVDEAPSTFSLLLIFVLFEDPGSILILTRGEVGWLSKLGNAQGERG